MEAFKFFVPRMHNIITINSHKYTINQNNWFCISFNWYCWTGEDRVGARLSGGADLVSKVNEVTQRLDIRYVVLCEAHNVHIL